MIGAILGDIVGSVYEFDNIKSKDFELFTKDCVFTDDTVLTCAVAKALLETDAHNNIDAFKEHLIKIMHKIGRKYHDSGFGGRFYRWVLSDSTLPYGSFGNGSAMRVSPVAWYASSLSEAEALAKASAEITHNHHEGIKGAVAVAGAIYLARTGSTKDEIKSYCNLFYDLNFTLDDIRPFYEFNETCQGSVPQAIVAFLESVSFEDAIRNAISIGGDSDTIADITGAVAEGFYGIPEDLSNTALSFLEEDLLEICNNFIESV